MSRKKTDWVVGGGKAGETAHCQRCGEGLNIGTQRIEVALAAMKAFLEIHSHCQPGQWEESIPASVEQWAGSRDTGVSSGTIYKIFTGRRVYDTFDVPHDPADFGRCYRLLKLAPKWVGQLQKVADEFPEWQPFVSAWPKLTEMYEQAPRTGERGEMYYFMRTLRAEE